MMSRNPIQVPHSETQIVIVLYTLSAQMELITESA
jgi:hypothetical protein